MWKVILLVVKSWQRNEGTQVSKMHEMKPALHLAQMVKFRGEIYIYSVLDRKKTRV